MNGDNVRQASTYGEWSRLRLALPLVGLILTLVWASNFSEEGPKGPDFEQFDKIAHFFVYGLMATLFFRVQGNPLKDPRRCLWAFALTLLYGLIDEWIQSFNPRRSADHWDWLADGIGALVAIIVYRDWRWYRELLETPIGGILAKLKQNYSNRENE